MNTQKNELNITKTVCPYCGVGCGVLASIDEDGSISISGDPEHPANFGRLCSKGSALGETTSLDGRLLHPEINGERVSWDHALSKVALEFAKVIDQHGADAVAFYVSGQLLTEDYYLANKLMKGFIGSANIDTNSRLCMSSTVSAYKRAFGSDTVPCCYEDLERAKLIVLTGSNTAWCHPVLFQRINQAKRDNPDLIVVVIDPRRTPTCDIADLHLPIKSGSDAILFNGLLNELHQKGETNALYTENFTEGRQAALNAAVKSSPSAAEVAKSCGLDENDVSEFYRLFSRTERVVSVFSQGINQSSSGTDKVNAIINCHLLTGRIGRPGMGPFSFTGQVNAMGGREVGGLSNQLAAHMDIDDASHRELVQRFWQAPVIAENPGLKAVELFDAISEGKIKAVWIMCTNPVVSLPNADKVKAALINCDFVVVSECIQKTDTTSVANVLLPALTWGEKDGTVTNSERRISRQRPFLSAPGEAKPDHWIITEVARKMGFEKAFEYKTSADVFREHAALSGFENANARDFDISGLSVLSDNEYGELKPIQWPVKKAGKGTTRMFTDGQFFTSNRKSKFIAITPSLPANKTDSAYPFILNSGRTRDQWHTMTRTGKSPRLTEHSPEPYAEIHPNTAKKIGILEGELVRVSSSFGEVIVRTRLSDETPQKTVFIPMHWGSQYASNGRVNAVVNPVVDLLSGQPEFKHTPVQITRYHPAWHGFLLSRRQLNLPDATYWARATGKSFYRYELAGEQEPGDWAACARQWLCTLSDDINWLEYLDISTGRYRGVRLIDNRVESCIFIAPPHELPSRSWLGGLFTQNALSNDERKSLLTGRPPTGQADVGRIVCACFTVGVNTLTAAITSQKLTTPEMIGKALKAGTNCGSCVPELRTLISKVLS